MNKLLTKIAGVALGLTMAIGVGVAIGENKESKPIFASSTTAFTLSSADSVTQDGVTVNFAEGDGSNAPTWYAAGLRLYASNTISISCSNNITGVSFNWEKQGNKAFASVTASPGTYSHPSAAGAGTWTGSATSITFTLGSSGQLQLNTFSVTYESGGSSSDWVTTAISISKTNTLAETIYNTDEEFPTFNDITVTKTEHDNNGIADDKTTDVTSSATLHWVYSDGTDVTLPIATNDIYNVKIWASVAGETLTSKDNATEANKYVTGTLTVTDEPLHVTIAYTNTSTTTNMTGNNDAATLGVSATDWSVIGYTGSASNRPGLNKAKQIRLYGNVNGGNYISVNTLVTNRYIVKIELSTANSTNYAVYEGDQNISGTAVTGSNDTYSFSDEVTGFTILNTNSDNTQVYILSINVYYEDVAVTTPLLVLHNTPSSVGIGNTAKFTVEYFNLTANFVVSTDTTYVTASYTGASGNGEATVTLTGLVATNSTTITVSSTGATSQSFNVEVALLPVIDTNLSSLSWGSTSYGTSPHTATWNSSYDFVVSAGQYASGIGYLGANSNNSAYSNLSNDNCALKGSALLSAISAQSSVYPTYTYGAAFYMSNFGVLHPTEFTVNLGTVGSLGINRTWAILASEDSGSTWEVLTGENSTSSGAIVAETNLSWSSNSKYASNSNNVQFAFFISYSSVSTVSNVSIVCYGDSYATTKVLDSIYVSGTPTTEYFAGESFDLGSAKVYARYADSVSYPDEDVSSQVTFSAIEHGTTSVTITYLNKTTTVNVTVEDYGDEYKKITSLDELLNGSKVVLGSNAGTALMGVQNTNNRKAEAAGYSDGYVTTYSINTAVFTVGVVEENSETYYTFKDVDDKYLYAGSTSGNYLYSGTELTDSGKWSLAISNTGAVEATVSVSVSGEATTKYMAGNASAFGCYTSLGTTSLSIFVDVENNVSIFESTYMHTDIAYNPEPTLPVNNTGNCDSQGWYVSAKAALIAMGQDYIDEFTTNVKFANAYARYLAWAGVCKDSTPFEGEGIVQALNAKQLLGIESINNSTVSIIVIVSLVSVTALGGYFFIKKKKEQ